MNCNSRPSRMVCNCCVVVDIEPTYERMARLSWLVWSKTSLRTGPGWTVGRESLWCWGFWTRSNGRHVTTFIRRTSWTLTVALLDTVGYCDKFLLMCCVLWAGDDWSQLNQQVVAIMSHDWAVMNFHAMTLCKLFTPEPLVTQQGNLWWCSVSGKVTTSLVLSTGSLPLGSWHLQADWLETRSGFDCVE